MKQNNLLLFAAIAVFVLSAGFLVYEALENSSNIVREYNNRDNRLYKLEDSFSRFETALLIYMDKESAAQLKDVRQEYDSFQALFYKVMYSILAAVQDDHLVSTDRLKKASESVSSIKDRLWIVGVSQDSLDDAQIEKSLQDLRRIRSSFSDINVLLLHNAIDSYQGTPDREGMAHIIMGVIAMAASSIAFLGLVLQSHRHLAKLGLEKQQTIELAEIQIQALEAAQEGVAILDETAHYKYVNEAYVEYHGYDNAEMLLSKNLYLVYDEETQAWMKSEVFPLINKDGTWHGQAKGLRKDGTRFPQELSLTSLKGKGFVLVVRDISNRLEQEKLLETRLAAIEASTDGIGLVNKDGKFLFMNKALLKLHGVDFQDKDKYIGQDWLSLYNERGRADIEKFVLPSVRQTGEWRGEHKVGKKNSEAFWAETSLKKLDDGTMVGIVRDISERKKSDIEREDLQGQLYQAQKMEAIGRLAGGIAHDFNNILAAMMGNAEFLMEDLQDRPKQQKFSEKIYQAGEQAKDLVDQMLTFSRRRDTAHDSVDVIQSVLEAASMLEASLPKTIDLKTNVDMSSATMLGNGTQISQSIMNLCVNAKDALKDERGQIVLSIKSAQMGDLPVRRYLYSDTELPAEGTPSTRIKEIGGRTWVIIGFLQKGEEYAHLEVADSGCGMKRSVMEHIFEPFFTTKAVDKGTGLGLASVHGVVLGHKGAMVVESAERQGTIFHLFFPLTRQADAANSQVVEGVDVVENSTGYRVLVVDDQEDVREMTAQKLKRIGCQVHSCASGLEAIDYLRENIDSCDLVLSDQNMPKMSGIDMAQQIEEDFPGLPVVIISGYAPEKMLEETKGVRAIKAVLKKPVSTKALSQKIHSVLEEYKVKSA